MNTEKKFTGAGSLHNAIIYFNELGGARYNSCIVAVDYLYNGKKKSCFHVINKCNLVLF